MNQGIELALYACLGLLHIYIVHSGYQAFFGMARSASGRLYFGVLSVFWALSTLAVWLHLPSAVNIAVTVAFLLALSFCYRSSMLNRLIAMGVFYLLGMGSELATAFFASTALHISISNLMQSEQSVIYSITLSKLFLLLISRLFYPVFMRLRNKNTEPNDVSRRYRAILLCLPIITIGITHLIFLMTRSSPQSLWGTATTALLLLTNFLYFYLYDSALQFTAAQHDIESLTRQMEAYDKSYLEIERTQKLISTMAHDFENKLLGLYSMAQNNEEIATELSNMLGTVRQSQRAICTGIPIVDLLINHKTAYADQHSIRISAQITLPSSLDIDKKGFAILLGNALDNAIEACMGLPQEQRHITLRLFEDKGNLCLVLKNPYRGTLKFDADHNPMSTKEHPSAHGYGLRSIRHIVEDGLGGYVQISTQGSEFVLRVLLFDVVPTTPP